MKIKIFIWKLINEKTNMNNKWKSTSVKSRKEVGERVK